MCSAVQVHRSYNLTGDTFLFLSLKGKVQTMQNIVSEHEQYLDSLRDFNDWLVSAKEELQRWSDLSGDSVSIKRKLQKVQVRSCTCHMCNTITLIIVKMSSTRGSLSCFD